MKVKSQINIFHIGLLSLTFCIFIACTGGGAGGGGGSGDNNALSDDDDDGGEKYSLTVTAPADGIYAHGEDMDFILTSANTISFTGTPRIRLSIGNNTVFADYVSSAGGTSHTFTYTVDIQDKDDIDEDGITWDDDVELNGGTMKFDSGEDVGDTELDIDSADSVYTHVGTFLAWYDASAGDTISDAGEAYVGDAGFTNAVDVWNDKAGDANMTLNLQGGVATYSATGLNSKPSIDFSGATYFEANDSIFSNNTTFTIIAVAFADSTTGNRQILAERNTQEVLFGNQNGNFSISQMGRSVSSAGAISGEASPFILCATTDASESNLYLNDSTSLNSSSTALTTDASLQDLRVGRQYSGGQYWDGDISEILIFDEALGDTQRDALIDYLEDKWDI